MTNFQQPIFIKCQKKAAKNRVSHGKYDIDDTLCPLPIHQCKTSEVDFLKMEFLGENLKMKLLLVDNDENM